MRILNETDLNGLKLVTIYGSSSDTKPSKGIADGSVFIETDTHDVYMYDETATIWRKM